MRQQLHDGVMACVIENRDVCEPFEITNVTNGVKQGCALTPSLFSSVFAVMRIESLKDTNKGVYIRLRIDDKLFNLKQSQAQTKTIIILPQGR